MLYGHCRIGSLTKTKYIMYGYMERLRDMSYFQLRSRLCKFCIHHILLINTGAYDRKADIRTILILVEYVLFR